MKSSVLSKLIPSHIITPFDLHVLSTPPAFILSQDQTLDKKFCCAQLRVPASRNLGLHCCGINFAGFCSRKTRWLIPFFVWSPDQNKLGFFVSVLLYCCLVCICPILLWKFSLRIFRVALLFMCQGSVLCAWCFSNTQRWYIIIPAAARQYLFWKIF